VSRCHGHLRHWFSVDARLAGGIGLRSPVCVRCGAPNPTPLTTDDWQQIAEVYPEKYGELVREMMENLAHD